MKKLLVILLLLVYGSSSSGMTLYFHYCCGKLKTIDLTPSRHKGCGKHTQFQKTSCCQSQTLELKVKSEHKGEQVIHSYDANPAPLQASITLPAAPVTLLPVTPVAQAPPRAGPSKQVLHCVFRI